MFTSRYAAAVLSAGALVLAACQPAQQAAPTSPPPAAAATPAPAAAANPSPAASPATAASPSAAAAAASPAAKPAASPAASPVASPVAAAAAPPDPGCPNQPVAGAKPLRVGLVTDVGKVDDRSFNQSAWEGVQCAQKNGIATDIKFIETTASTDYGPNIDQFAQDNYDVIVTVGFLLSPATVVAAQKYPNIKFIGVDQFQDPAAPAVPNLAGLVFDEDKSGYLAGYLAGSLNKSGTVGLILGLAQVPAVEKYGIGYINGAKAAKSGIKVLTACASSFTDPVWGNTTANQEMGQNADILFAAAGLTGNGALLAAVDKGGSVLGIGVDTDQYLSLPEAKSILVSSAMKLIVPGVFNIVKAAQAGSFKGANITGDVGLAPYHDLDSKVPADLKTKMNQLTADVAAGRTKTGFDKATGSCPPAG